MRAVTSLFIAAVLCVSLVGCETQQAETHIVATTLPVYEFTTRLCKGTDLQVSRMITENVSCLHDYTLKTNQMRMIEEAQVIVLSGSGLEEFMTAALPTTAKIVDASWGISLVCNEQDHAHSDSHHHDEDPHIWLSPANAKQMAEAIYTELIAIYPAYADRIKENLTALVTDFDNLESYASKQLSDLSCRELITFHDGFSYMANAFGLAIVHAIEEESGSEASAAELIDLIDTVKDHNLDVIFTERNGSCAAAEIISAETGVEVYQLDMAISGDSYFDAMYHNVNTLKEALG